MEFSWSQEQTPATALPRHLYPVAEQLSYLFEGRIDGYHDAVGVDQEFGRDLFDAVGFGGGGIKRLGFHQVVGPDQLVRLDGFLPIDCAALEGDAYDFEAGGVFKFLVFIVGIQAHQLWMGLSAGAAPASPEVEEDVFTFEVGEAKGGAVG